MVQTDVMPTLLAADFILMPFEVNGGLRQVCLLIAVLGDQWVSFETVDDDRPFPGAVTLRPSLLSSAQMQDEMEASPVPPQRIKPRSIRVVATSILADGEVLTGIEELTFVDDAGAELTLQQDGAYYPYNLTIRE